MNTAELRSEMTQQGNQSWILKKMLIGSEVKVQKHVRAAQTTCFNNLIFKAGEGKPTFIKGQPCDRSVNAQEPCHLGMILIE